MIKCIAYCGFLLLNALVFAQENKVQNFKKLFSHPVMAITGGPGWVNPGDKQNLYLDYDFNNGYRSQQNNQPVGFLEAYIALQHQLDEKNTNQFGVAFSGAWMAKRTGQVWQYNNPEFYNYDYTYNLRQLRLALRDKLIFDQGLFNQKLMPYITGSVGIGFNKAYSYTETPLDTSIVSSPSFSNRTVNAFTYSVGGGVQTAPWNNLIFAVGYEFMDWGRSSLGMASGQILPGAPGMSHLYMNSLLFSVTASL